MGRLRGCFWIVWSRGMSVSELLQFLRMNKRIFSYDDFGVHLIIEVATQCCVCELAGDYEEFSSCTNLIRRNGTSFSMKPD